MSFKEIVCEFVFITLDVLVTWMCDNNAYLFRHKFINVRGSAVVKGELETIESRSKVYLNVDRGRERFFYENFALHYDFWAKRVMLSSYRTNLWDF